MAFNRIQFQHGMSIPDFLQSAARSVLLSMELSVILLAP
jgi:hypothetical protein